MTWKGLNSRGSWRNCSPDAKETRAIDIREGEKIDDTALKALVKEAVLINK
jgi:hypothetical protein